MSGKVLPTRFLAARVAALEAVHAGEVRGGVVEAWTGGRGEVHRYEPRTHIEVYSVVQNKASRAGSGCHGVGGKAIRPGVSSLENLARKKRRARERSREHNLNPDGGS